MNMRLTMPGGRVKAAAVGLNHFYCSKGFNLEEELGRLRKNPPNPLLEAFFPNEPEQTKVLLKRIGFYHPSLKTDQGMSGQFLPFWIDEQLDGTDLSVRTIVKEEGIAIPEAWREQDPIIVQHIQKHFSAWELGTANTILKTLGINRVADKGRLPFFFIRPALTDKVIVFGKDVIARVSNAVDLVLNQIQEKARLLEQEYCGDYKEDNLLYCQPDAYVLTDGATAVEKINCPDVGLFLSGLNCQFSTILPQIKDVVAKLEEVVCDTIVRFVNSSEIFILTRDSVIKNKEDILEIGEIEQLKIGLGQRDKDVRVVSLAKAGELPSGSTVLLLNLDYRAPEIDVLLKRHCVGELNCYPNPFFQVASLEVTGLAEVEVPAKYREGFLRLTSAHPKDARAFALVTNQLEQLLCKYGLTSDILYADIEREVIPIFRYALHSWHQLRSRLNRYDAASELRIRLRSVPAHPDNLLITSETGPRLHVFRFMFVKT